MTTTACDDQFVINTERHITMYSIEAILRRNVADLEIALRAQIERAEAAEAELLAIREDNHSMMLEIDGLRTELAKLAQQEPVAYVKYKATGGNVGLSWLAVPTGAFYPREGEQLYAAPVTIPHKGATHCDDCGLTWLDDGLNPLRCPYCKDTVPAPAVPEEWREVMAELAADLQSACDAEHPHRDQYPSVMRKYQNDMRIVERARALLQSADHSEQELLTSPKDSEV